MVCGVAQKREVKIFSRDRFLFSVLFFQNEHFFAREFVAVVKSDKRAAMLQDRVPDVGATHDDVMWHLKAERWAHHKTERPAKLQSTFEL